MRDEDVQVLHDSDKAWCCPKGRMAPTSPLWGWSPSRAPGVSCLFALTETTPKADAAGRAPPFGHGEGIKI